MSPRQLAVLYEVALRPRTFERDHHVKVARGLLAQPQERLIFGRGVPGVEVGHVWKLDDNNALRFPGPAFEHSMASSLGEVPSTERPAPSGPTLAIGQADLDTFEKLLGDIQTAYGREDIEQLGEKTTPEMLSYFSQDLAENTKQGVHNEVSGVKLLQGDLSEAWRENGLEYATVAMRFSIIDAMVDRANGRVVSGDRTRPTEATELWTFRRDDRARTDGWQLSAIQQAA